MSAAANAEQLYVHAAGVFHFLFVRGNGDLKFVRRGEAIRHVRVVLVDYNNNYFMLFVLFTAYDCLSLIAFILKCLLIIMILDDWII